MSVQRNSTYLYRVSRSASAASQCKIKPPLRIPPVGLYSQWDNNICTLRYTVVRFQLVNYKDILKGIREREKLNEKELAN